MPELAVLRSPDAVLFGTGMAGASGGAAARHGRRVLVITDPVLAATAGFDAVLGSLSRAAGLDAVVFGEAAIDVPMATIDAAHAPPATRAPMSSWRSAGAARSTSPR